jgi:cytochrome c5
MKFTSITAFIFLFACTAAKLIQPTQADAERGAAQFPGYTLADLTKGKLIFEENCGMCHGLKNPKSHSEEQWKKIVPDMAQQVRKKNPSFDSNNEQAVLRYLLTMRNS